MKLIHDEQLEAKVERQIKQHHQLHQCKKAQAVKSVFSFDMTTPNFWDQEDPVSDPEQATTSFSKAEEEETQTQIDLVKAKDKFKMINKPVSPKKDVVAT